MIEKRTRNDGDDDDDDAMCLLLMFEPPFTGDFDLDVEFGSSLQHPFSLRSRLREVREAFRGFRTSSCNACVALRKPMKEIEVAIQFLHEVIRTDKYEVLIGSASAVFDAVLAYIALLKYPVPHVQLLDWVENKILCSDIYDDVTSQSESSSNGEGVRLATELLKAIMETEENSQDTNLKSRKDAIVDKLHNMHESISEKLNDPGFENTFDNDATSFSGRSVENSEEREEKKDTKTCEEEVQKLSDGSEIRTRKTKTFNMKQNSKQVTIRSHGNSGNETVNIFHDGNMSFKNDLATDNFFTSRKPSVHTDLNRSKHFNDVLESTDKSNNESECISQKIRSVHHTDTVSQRVSKTAMKNGKIVWDDAAHKIDKNELNATQVEIFKNDKIIGRQGSGSYEEKSTVKMGLTQLSSSPPIPPKQRHVVQYMQTFGNEREDQDDFFKGSTLASYITLNDNLRYYEEQYKKQISFEFSLSGMLFIMNNILRLTGVIAFTEPFFTYH
ncbi:unnamed protein product [Thelazia callipaeda]|uniref:Cyclin_C domain-containing protein n=1 Tax=Thelazia callipaeda TaxID=103827 RepID=A0A0N5DAF9_THECL|nr:unnamed protein product [Thelazia callipaeda]